MSTPRTLPPKESLPAYLRAGDALAWNVQTRSPFPSTVFYVLTGVIKGVPTRQTIGGTGLAVDPTTGLVAFSLASTDTAAYAPGKYQWVCFAVDASANRTELGQGVIRIQPNVAGTNPVDPRTYNEKVLHAIRCVIMGTVNDDIQMYKIGTREVTKMPRMDLLKQEAIFERRVKNERIRRGEIVRGNTIGITFGGGGRR